MASPDAQGARLPHLYATDADHGWSVGMRAMTHMLLHGCSVGPGPILELGCGGGALLADLQTNFPHRPIVGSDRHPLALAYAHSAAPHALLYQGDLHHLPFARGAFAAVLALDTLDQSGVAPKFALQEAARVLLPGGIILVRVSAHPWLLSPHDAAFNTDRRYSRRELCRIFQDADLSVQRVSYANAFIGLPAIPLRLFQRWKLIRWDERGSTSGRLTGALLSAALRVETLWLRKRNLPFGLSLYLIAQRQPQAEDEARHS